MLWLWLAIGFGVFLFLSSLITKHHNKLLQSNPKQLEFHLKMDSQEIKKRNNTFLDDVLKDTRLEHRESDQSETTAIMENGTLIFVNGKTAFTGNDGYREYEYDVVTRDVSEIIGYEIVVDDQVITQSQRGSQIGGALVGGALLGGVGAIIGGLSGKKRERKEIDEITVKIFVDDTNEPTRDIRLFNKEWYSDYQWEKRVEIALNEAEEWEGVLRTLMARQNKGNMEIQ